MPVIAESLFTRFRSRQDDSFGCKVLAALRNEFGGHAVHAAEGAPVRRGAATDRGAGPTGAGS